MSFLLLACRVREAGVSRPWLQDAHGTPLLGRPRLRTEIPPKNPVAHRGCRYYTSQDLLGAYATA